jgi:hypothetical protein
MRNMPDYEIKRGSYEWYLYHHIKNEEPIIPLIVLSCFFLICNGGFIMLLLAWGFYFNWASNNNKELDNDPEILKKREKCKSMHEYLKNNKINL